MGLRRKLFVRLFGRHPEMPSRRQIIENNRNQVERYLYELSIKKGISSSALVRLEDLVMELKKAKTIEEIEDIRHEGSLTQKTSR